jgi:hypothetical protein
MKRTLYLGGLCLLFIGLASALLFVRFAVHIPTLQSKQVLSSQDGRIAGQVTTPQGKNLALLLAASKESDFEKLHSVRVMISQDGSSQPPIVFTPNLTESNWLNRQGLASRIIEPETPEGLFALKPKTVYNIAIQSDAEALSQFSLWIAWTEGL